MARFIAKQAYNTTILGGLSMLITPRNVLFEDRESDGFRVESLTSDTVLTVGGDDFSYRFFRPRPVGTITELKLAVDGMTRYKITGTKIELRDLVSTNTAEATKMIFAGDDKFTGSEGNDTLVGCDGDDHLAGRVGNDLLQGKKGNDILNGGPGFDRLDGGGGQDTYRFKNVPAGTSDTVLAFDKRDRIEVSSKVFDGLTLGRLAEEGFVKGTAFTDEDQRFRYDPKSGGLFHDPNGSDATIGAVRLATLPTNLKTLEAGDIFVI
jgi:Ca2+-binding RTX toxin-like protein